MPFGLIFGALFFGGFGSWLGLRLIGQPGTAAKVAGAFLVLLSLSLSLGLLLRRRWARWAGLLAAALMAAYAIRLVAVYAGVGDHLLLFASVAASLLLLIPATGAAHRGAPVAASPQRVGALELCAVLGFVGVLGAVVWGGGEATRPRQQHSSVLPASAVTKRIQWSDFGTGIEQARAAGRPILATFVTDWCPYCSKMDRKTWRAPAVVERLDELVAVRVDAEDESEKNGYSGVQLAERYQLRGLPMQLLLDADGEVISRADGYQTPRQLLKWLDGALGGSG